jgi:homoserine O-succinyltransferase
VFRCAHGRHSGSARRCSRKHATGSFRPLSHGVETGYSIVESVDGRFLMHLGHPEYEAGRLVHEWERDSQLQHADVEAPRNFDVHRPLDVWRSHCNDLFSRWLRQVALADPPRRAIEVDASI